MKLAPSRPVISAIFIVLTLSNSVFATNLAEGVGDFSGDIAAPESFVLEAGANTLTATSVKDDLEYVKVTVPSGLALATVFNTAYSGAAKSFMGIEKGPVFTFTPAHLSANQAADTALMIGWTHFGPTQAGANVGDDILDNASVAAGAQGFAPPLVSGDYTLWLQETSMTAVTYTLTFNAVAAVFEPVFSPVTGSYDSPLKVTISSATAGATIYYTTDGSDPTMASAVYSAPLTIKAATTVKAFGVKAGTADSGISTVAYTIKAPTVTVTGGKSVTSTKPKVVIKGTASSDVTKVEYRIGSGPFKKATGKTSWKITAKLPVGKSVISVRATGSGGTSKLVKIKVKVKF